MADSSTEVIMENQKKQSNISLKIIIAMFFVASCVVLVLGILYYYKLGPSYFEPKIPIILEPDYSIVTTVDPSDLETDAQILTARCRELGYGISFRVAKNNQIIAQAPKSLDIQAFERMAVGIGLVEIVDFGEAPISPGTTIATDFDYKYLPQVKGTRWHTVIANSEFESVEVTNKYGLDQVSFTLTSTGKEIFANYTQNNTGHYAGIVLDRVVISAPQVTSPITEGIIYITAELPKDAVESLAVYLNTPGPLPIPLKVK